MTDQLLLITAWHLPRMRSMPRLLWRLRALDRGSRDAVGLRWMHRWLSRRSLLLTSRWDSAENAERWLASEAFRHFDQLARAVPGAVARIERHHPTQDAPPDSARI